jgi:hypothetical protein
MPSGNVAAATPTRIAAGAPPIDEPSSPRDYAEPAPSAGTGSSADARPPAQLALQPPRKKRKVQSKTYLFRDEHCRTYGLKVTSRLASSGHVDPVQCRFCVVYGREAKEAAKRRMTENSKFFKHPFRPDNYVAHLKSTHAARWEEYSKLCDKEKDAYFSSTVPVLNTMLAHVDTTMSLTFIIDGEIVEGVIGDLLLDPDDDASTKDTALRAFKLNDPAMASLQVASRQYHVEVKNVRQYLLCVGFVGHSCSFRQAVSMLALTREITGLSSLGTINEAHVATYARIACSVVLQKLRDILGVSWAFSFALDTSTVEGTGFMDVRIRVCLAGKIINAHALALPLRDKHTGEVMFNELCRLLDALCENWRDKVLSISTDGDRSMVGSVRGVATRMENVAKPGFLRVWCGL